MTTLAAQTYIPEFADAEPVARQKILIAEDNPKLLKLCTRVLKHAGYDVVTAADGYTALAAAVAEKPDLLILDIHMPAGSGFTVQQRFEAATHSAAVPVIYTSCDHSPGACKCCEELDAYALLSKPFTPDSLLRTVSEALDYRKAA